MNPEDEWLTVEILGRRYMAGLAYDSVIVRLEDGSEAGELARAKVLEDLAVRFLLERARAMAPKRKGKRS